MRVPFVLIEDGIMRNIKEIFKKYGFTMDKTLIITGINSGSILSKYDLECDIFKITNKSDYNEIKELEKTIIKGKYDLLISFGGGSIVDIGKYVSFLTNTRLLVIPTLLSNDAFASDICILRLNGEYNKFKVCSPFGIIIDLEIIQNSPKKYILSGVGELISNISATFDWKLSQKIKKEKINYPALLLSKYSGRFLIDLSFNDLKDKNLLFNLANGLVLSGMAITIAGSSRPASGSEHNISHALDKILKNKRKPHGIQVGFATILTLFLQGQFFYWKKVISFYDKIGFPKTFKEVGIDVQDFLKSLEIAPKIRDRFTILNQYKLEEMIAFSDLLLNR